MQSPAPTSPPGIPDFALLRLIGRGSYGDVWLARGITGAFRAVKLVWRDRFADARPYEREFEGITRFAAVSLREPSQLALLHAGRNEEGKFFYYVMELADDVTRGRDIDPAHYQPLTLKERAADGPLPVAEVIALGVPLARALASLHAAGLVHRDIKPSNIIFVGGVPKLADVGLVAAASAALTFVGTEGFVAPEGPGTPAADVYGLGKVLYELATRLDRHDFPRLPENLEARPDHREFLELNEVLLRACEPDGRRRYPDATALLDELLLLQAGRSVRRLRKAEQRLTRSVRVAAVLAVVAAITGFGIWVERERANQEYRGRLAAEAERDELARRTVYTATLAQAERSLEHEDYSSARKLLHSVEPKPGEPDLRGFEWRALRSEAAGDPSVVVTRANKPWYVKFSPDESQLAVLDSGRTLSLHSVADHRKLWQAEGVLQLGGFSADGKWLLGADLGNAPRRWSVAEGQAGPAGPAAAGNRTLGVSGSDGLLLFTESPRPEAGSGQPAAPHRLHLWDGATQTDRWSEEVPHTGGKERADYFRSAVSADGRWLALALVLGRGPDSTWRLWIADLETRATWFDGPLDGAPNALAWDPSGKKLAAAFLTSDRIKVLDLDRGSWRWALSSGFDAPRTVAFLAPDRLVVGGRSQTLRLLTLDEAGPAGEIRGLEGEPATWYSVDTAVRSGQVATAGKGDMVQLWTSAFSRVPVAVLTGFHPVLDDESHALSPDGSQLAVPNGNAQVRVMDSRSGRAVATIPDAFSVLGFDPAGELWILSTGGTARRWKLSPALEMTRQIGLFPEGKTTLGGKLDPAGKFMAAYTGDGWLKVQPLEGTAAGMLVRAAPDTLAWVATAPDGRHLLTTSHDLKLRLWRYPEGTQAAEWPVADLAFHGAFSPDGTRLLTAHAGGTLEVRRLSDPGQVERTLDLGGRAIHCLLFHPTEPRLFAGSGDGLLHVIDTRTWREVIQLPATPGKLHPAELTQLALSADGAVLAAYLTDGTVRLWRTR